MLWAASDYCSLFLPYTVLNVLQVILLLPGQFYPFQTMQWRPSIPPLSSKENALPLAIEPSWAVMLQCRKIQAHSRAKGSLVLHQDFFRCHPGALCISMIVWAAQAWLKMAYLGFDMLAALLSARLDVSVIMPQVRRYAQGQGRAGTEGGGLGIFR